MRPMASVPKNLDSVSSLLLTDPFLIATFEYACSVSLHLNICISCKAPCYFQCYVRKLGYSWDFWISTVPGLWKDTKT